MTIISTQVFQIGFGSDGELLEVTTNGLVYSNSLSPALDSNGHIDLTLINIGNITNTNGISIYFDPISTGKIINEIGGYIGGDSGIKFESTGVSLFNFGTVLGTHGYAIVLGDQSSGNIIHNSNAIHGGILDSSSKGGNRVINSGTIDGLDFFGVNLDLQTGKVLHLINSGTIAGADAAIHGQSGALDLDNTGTVAGSIALESNDADAIYNKGVIEGAVFLGGGKDIFLGTGGGSSAVFGEAGNDHLVGSALGDTLNGGTDDDRLFGVGGSDTLTGGAGVDSFVFGSGLATAGVDAITDFEHGIDHIELKHAIFTKTNVTSVLAKGMFFAGAHAHDANDRIIYNPTNGWLIYDKNGNATGGANHFATLDAHLGLSALDFLII